MLFRGDDIYKQIGLLSGGERARVRLAQLLLDKPNVLVMDEPTNHLDIPSREALESTLASFDGTMWRVHTVDATALAKSVGAPQAIGFVLLGAYNAVARMVEPEALAAAMEELLPPYRRQHAPANRKALEAGHGAS